MSSDVFRRIKELVNDRGGLRNLEAAKKLKNIVRHDDPIETRIMVLRIVLKSDVMELGKIVVSQVADIFLHWLKEAEARRDPESVLIINMILKMWTVAERKSTEFKACRMVMRKIFRGVSKLCHDSNEEIRRKARTVFMSLKTRINKQVQSLNDGFGEASSSRSPRDKKPFDSQIAFLCDHRADKKIRNIYKVQTMIYTMKTECDNDQPGHRIKILELASRLEGEYLARFVLLNGLKILQDWTKEAIVRKQAGFSSNEDKKIISLVMKVVCEVKRVKSLSQEKRNTLLRLEEFCTDKKMPVSSSTDYAREQSKKKDALGKDVLCLGSKTDVEQSHERLLRAIALKDIVDLTTDETVPSTFARPQNRNSAESTVQPTQSSSSQGATDRDAQLLDLNREEKKRSEVDSNNDVLDMADPGGDSSSNVDLGPKATEVKNADAEAHPTEDVKKVEAKTKTKRVALQSDTPIELKTSKKRPLTSTIETYVDLDWLEPSVKKKPRRQLSRAGGIAGRNSMDTKNQNKTENKYVFVKPTILPATKNSLQKTLPLHPKGVVKDLTQADQSRNAKETTQDDANSKKRKSQALSTISSEQGKHELGKIMQQEGKSQGIAVGGINQQICKTRNHEDRKNDSTGKNQEEKEMNAEESQGAGKNKLNFRSSLKLRARIPGVITPSDDDWDEESHQYELLTEKEEENDNIEGPIAIEELDSDPEVTTAKPNPPVGTEPGKPTSPKQPKPVTQPSSSKSSVFEGRGSQDQSMEKEKKERKTEMPESSDYLIDVLGRDVLAATAYVVKNFPSGNPQLRQIRYAIEERLSVTRNTLKPSRKYLKRAIVLFVNRLQENHDSDLMAHFFPEHAAGKSNKHTKSSSGEATPKNAGGERDKRAKSSRGKAEPRNAREIKQIGVKKKIAPKKIQNQLARKEKQAAVKRKRGALKTNIPRKRLDSSSSSGPNAQTSSTGKENSKRKRTRVSGLKKKKLAAYKPPNWIGAIISRKFVTGLADGRITAIMPRGKVRQTSRWMVKYSDGYQESINDLEVLEALHAHYIRYSSTGVHPWIGEKFAILHEGENGRVLLQGRIVKCTDTGIPFRNLTKTVWKGDRFLFKILLETGKYIHMDVQNAFLGLEEARLVVGRPVCVRKGRTWHRGVLKSIDYTLKKCYGVKLDHESRNEIYAVTRNRIDFVGSTTDP